MFSCYASTDKASNTANLSVEGKCHTLCFYYTPLVLISSSSPIFLSSLMLFCLSNWDKLCRQQTFARQGSNLIGPDKPPLISVAPESTERFLLPCSLPLVWCGFLGYVSVKTYIEVVPVEKPAGHCWTCNLSRKYPLGYVWGQTWQR